MNLKKAVQLSMSAWDAAYAAGIIDLNATLIEKNRYRLEDGREFLHMCSCSYLGLDSDPYVLSGAIQAIQEQHTASWIATSRNRLKLKILQTLEEQFSDYYKAHVLTATTCSSGTAGLLPLLAAGLFTSNESPIMIFDKSAHFSMAYMKALCADEAEVLTCPADDMNYVEDVCKKNKVVAYIADGVNSVGGAVPVKDLLCLQEKYNLFLYLDDSHSLSSYGKQGYGYVRSYIPELNEKIIIVASLAKAFGTSGGLLMLGSEQQKLLMTRYGGPNLWSQGMNICAVGSSLKSLDIHRSEKLNVLQKKLKENIELFDSLIMTEFQGNPFTIRIIRIGDDEKTINLSKKLLDEGFYTSAVFFPIVGRNKAGIRVMLRADMEKEDIVRFSEILKRYL